MYDVTIIGAGIVGTYIAKELGTKTNLKICLIEAGNLNYSNNNLNYHESGKKEFIKITNSYKFGGGHNVWHGLLARLNDQEIENDLNLWNIDRQDFNKYFDNAEKYFGLNKRSKKHITNLINKDFSELKLDTLNKKIFFQPKLFHKPKKIYEELISLNINVLLNTRVLKIIDSAERYIIHSENSNVIYTKKIILAANPIQIGSILLNSNYCSNDNKLLFCDHPMGVVAKIEFKNPVRLPIWFIRKKIKNIYSKVGFIINDKINNLDHTFYIIPSLESTFNINGDNLRQNLIAIRDKGLSYKLLLQIFKNIPTLLFIITYKFGFVPKSKYADLLIVSEQDIDKNNFIEINNNILVKNWSISKILIESIKDSASKLSILLNDIYPVNKFSLLTENQIRERLTSAAHLCCTVKCGGRDSLINDNFELKSKKGIYIAGSAVFPRAYSINNTLTAVAVSNKIIDNLLSSGTDCD
jgi:hypothetical protein